MNILIEKFQPYHGNNRIHFPKQGSVNQELSGFQDRKTGMREDNHRGQYAGEAASQMAQDTLTALEERYHCDNQISHALRGIRKVGAFLNLCQQYNIRLISLEDQIDTSGELYQETSTRDVLATIERLSFEVMQFRRVVRLLKETHQWTLKAGQNLDREKTIVNMYNSGHFIDDIWKLSAYKSRTDVFVYSTDMV